ncbi:MAG: hypothetical protein RBR53_08460 [Desulforegulaceae bacterium]|nr:hypothetical protein [Desulforegulaceae bacterium]
MPRFLFFLLFFLFSSTGFTQEFDQKILSKADKFFENKNYHKAEFFYDAYLLENNSCEVCFKTALCRYYTKRYEEAFKLFSEISENCEKKYSLPSFVFLSEIYLQINEPGLYISSLSNLERISDNNELKKKVLNDKVWFYLRFMKIEEARKEIGKTDLKTKSLLNFNELEKNIDILTKEKKSPFLSGVYSIVPGGGYLYCNRYKDAFFSFFINSLFAASAYEAFDNDMNLAGVLLSALTLGFYSGNIYGGIRAANVENNIYKARAFEELESRFRVKDLYKFKLEFKVDF